MTELIEVTYAIFALIIQYAAAGTIAVLLLVMLVIFIGKALSGDIE